MALVRFVAWLTDLSLRRWRTFLVVGAALAAGSAWLASHLDVRSSFEELLPEDAPTVRNARELARRVGGDGTVFVVVEAERGPQDLPRAEALASRLAEELRALGPEVIRSVQCDLGAVKRWYAEHWPLFLPLDDLRRTRDALVKAIGERKARLSPTMTLLDEEGAEAPGGRPSGALDLSRKELADLLDPARPSPREEVERGFDRYVDGYMVHPDRRSLTVLVRPTGTSFGVTQVRAVLDRMQAVVDRHRAEAEASHLTVAFGGSYPILLAEYETLLRGAGLSFLVVLAILLLSMLAFFGEVRLILALAAALLVAVAVTFGIAWLGIGYLNMQTAFLGSIVAGNGINYGVIYLGRLKQLRRRDVPLVVACHEAARVTASGTLLAALGTSVAYGTLLIATNRGFRHFGFIGGIGMVLCWLATFALLPALLVLFERVRPRHVRPRPPRRAAAVAALERLFRHPRTIVGVFSAMTIAAAAAYVWLLPSAMEQNLDNLRNDATGSAASRRTHERGQAAIGQSLAGAVALLPSRDAAQAYCGEIERRLRERPRLRELIQGCETITNVVPAAQPEKLALLRDVAERLTPRLLAQLPPDQARRAREIRAQLAAQRPLSDGDAPPSLLDRFRERDGALGRIAFVGAQSTAQLELVPHLREFAAAVRDVPVAGGRYDAAGVDIVAADLLADIERQGLRVTALSYLCVCALVALFFRRFRQGALLVASYTSGAILMVGITALVDIKINFFNIVAYPITFGIAADYGANVFSRMRVRRNVVPALVEVTPAMLICSWTAIVGSASLVASFSRALRSFGWYAIIGELATLTTATVFLPAMVKLLPPRLWHAPPGEAVDEEAVLRQVDASRKGVAGPPRRVG